VNIYLPQNPTQTNPRKKTNHTRTWEYTKQLKRKIVPEESHRNIRHLYELPPWIENFHTNQPPPRQRMVHSTKKPKKIIYPPISAPHKINLNFTFSDKIIVR